MKDWIILEGLVPRMGLLALLQFLESGFKEKEKLTSTQLDRKEQKIGQALKLYFQN